MATNQSVRLTVKKVDGEWAVIWYDGNIKNDAKSYYTHGGDKSHKEDAIATRRKMLEMVSIVDMADETFPSMEDFL